ncbi:retron St85 family effector protein [Stakelama marina]|uniref:Retron St85 family effector protein n=1 Tax=Stakelama marina TaxID=2826939 RepID=A0A8T4IGD3_9SPHN|nr:retron St85 family effector protein [Stakelama marina]MBR0553647.1 retron St85 family effector protein [Stakelama marina]
MLPDFTKYVNRGAIFVEPPTDLIFLCGGKTKKTSSKISSIRDAFLKAPDNSALKGREALLAEDVNTFHLSRPAYRDLLKFEIDFAQVCELILLFSESQGSIAELGAFSMMPELASKLLVVVRDYYYRDDSFIKLGPLQHLKGDYSERSVFVLNDDETGMVKNSIKNVNLVVLRDRLVPAINDHFERVKESATFNPERRGHLIKMMVGFAQEFGALTAAEVVQLFSDFDIEMSVEEVDRLMLCAEAAHWIVKETRGFNDYYFALPNVRDALVLKFDKGAPIFNKERRRQAFREHWRTEDLARFNGIQKFAQAAR